jgi:hypothetical protein
MSFFILPLFVALFVLFTFRYYLPKTPEKSETGEKCETPETGETPKPCETPETGETPKPGETPETGEKDTLPNIALAKGLSLNELHCRINDFQNIISKINSEISQISKQDQDHASKKMMLELNFSIKKKDLDDLCTRLYSK